MGYRVLLIAIAGKSAEEIYHEFGVELIDESEEIPESPVTGAVAPSGMYVLYVNDGIVPDAGLLSVLSQNASLLTCSVNETVMQSSIRSWANGAEQWSVIHDAQIGLKHLSISGQPPDSLKSIQERLLAKQSSDGETDFVFDVPVELFVTLGGIRYDQDLEGTDPEPWQVLARIRPLRKKWWPFR